MRCPDMVLEGRLVQVLIEKNARHTKRTMETKAGERRHANQKNKAIFTLAILQVTLFLFRDLLFVVKPRPYFGRWMPAPKRAGKGPTLPPHYRGPPLRVESLVLVGP